MSTARSSRSSTWRVDLVGAGSVCALTAIAYVLIVQPIARHQHAIAQMRSVLATSRSEAELAAAAHTRLSNELTRVNRAITDSPVRLESVDYLNQRLARIVGLASRSGMVIDESRAGAVQGGLRFDTVPIELSGTGSYPNCARFLHLIATEIPDAEVLGFELSGAPGAPGSKSQFKFDLAWYATSIVASGSQEFPDQP